VRALERLIALLPAHVQKIVGEIHRDHESGALPLSNKAAEALRLLVTTETTAHTDLPAQLKTLCHHLVAAQPSMAPIHALAWRCQTLCDTTPPPALRQAVVAALDDFQAQMLAGVERVAKFAIEVVPDGGKVLTTSSSSTVLRALRSAWAAGRRFQVVCTESRPQNEGLILARALAEADIPTTLILDAAIGEVIPDSVVIVGADACLPSGVVNKVGTRTLAMLANIHNVPCYALCSQEKFLPEKGAASFRIVAQAPEEILPEKITGVTVINRYFDITPLYWFDRLVTDLGILSPAEVLRKLNE